MACVIMCNLPRNIVEDDLRELFENYGNVDSVRFAMLSNHRVGVAEYADDSSAHDAVECLTGVDVLGQTVKVKRLSAQQADQLRPLPKDNGASKGGGVKRQRDNLPPSSNDDQRALSKALCSLPV